MSKLKTGVVAAGFTLMAFASPAFAIGSAAECESEGGDMLNVKGSDFCLVPIRPDEYKDPIYDGNQLGVVNCPGNKLNDGVYCMYPVTLRDGAKAASSTSMTDISSDTMTETAAPMTRSEERAAKKAQKEAEKAAKKAAKEAAK